MLGEGGVCILSRTKWDSLTNWLTEGERKQEKLEREKAYLKYMKEMSTQLVAGTHTKREAAAKRLEEKQKDGERREKIILEDYLRIRKNQKKERDEMMKKYVRETVVHRSPTLELTRALREAQVLEERRKDLELKQKIRENEGKMEEREIKQLKRQWEASERFHYKQEENRRCKLDQLKCEIWKQYQDIREKKQKERIELVDQERIDLLRMAEELEERERVKKEQQLSDKKKTLSLLKKAAEDAEKRRFLQKRQDNEIYRINEVINNALSIRNCHIEAKMKKNINERIDKNIKIYVDYMSQIPSVEPSEEAIYQNGLHKNQKEYEKKLVENEAKQKKAAEDKIKNYEEDIRRQKVKTEEEAEMKRMEMIERYKKTEAMKYFDQANEKEELRRKKQYAKELLSQAEEQKIRMKHEKKLEEEYVFHSYSSQDDHFVSYADEVIRFAKQKRWPTAPITKVIENYKKTQPLIQRRRRETALDRKSAVLTFHEEYTNISPKLKGKFISLEKEVREEENI